MVDRYRNRLKHAGWTWKEDRSWNQGKLLKDRSSGRADKRSARQADRAEVSEELVAVRFNDYDLLEGLDYDDEIR